MTGKQKTVKEKNGSAIFGLLKRFSEKIGKSFENGFFGKIFGCYTAENRAMKNSFAASLVKKGSKAGELIRKFKLIVAEQFETSTLLGIYRRLSDFFIHCRLRFFGSFLLTFGVYTGLIYFLKQYVIEFATANIGDLVFSAVAILVSLPLVLSKTSLSRALTTSKLGYFVAMDIIDVPEETLDGPSARISKAYNVAIGAGLIAGCLSMFIDPLKIIIAIVVVAAICIVMKYPEVGVLAALLVLPAVGITGAGFLCNIVLVYSISFFIKLIRGKRVIAFEITDLFMMIFIFTVLLGGAVTVTVGAGEDINRMIILLFGAFVAGNLMKTRDWQKKAVISLGISGTAVSMILIMNRVLSLTGSHFIINSTLYTKELTFYGDGNIQTGFLLITVMIAFAMICCSKTRKEKFASALAAVIAVAALLMTGSLPGVLGIATALITFFIILSDKVLITAILAIIFIPTGVSLLPPHHMKQVGYVFGRLKDSLITFRRVREGANKLILSSYTAGIGIGGFNEIYSMNAVVGAELLGNRISTWGQLTADLGVVGVIIPAAVIFLVIQNCFEYLRKPLNSKSKTVVASALALTAGITAMSFVFNIFGNACGFYGFWIIIALTTSIIRSDRNEAAISTAYTETNEYSASVDL